MRSSASVLLALLSFSFRHLYTIWAVKTVTLYAAAVKLNDLAKVMGDVIGTIASGVVGELLAVGGPVNTVAKPALATSKGKLKVMGEEVESALTIYNSRWVLLEDRGTRDLG
jgi:hypothetical protein